MGVVYDITDRRLYAVAGDRGVSLWRMQAAGGNPGGQNGRQFACFDHWLFSRCRSGRGAAG